MPGRGGLEGHDAHLCRWCIAQRPQTPPHKRVSRMCKRGKSLRLVWLQPRVRGKKGRGQGRLGPRGLEGRGEH